MTIQLNLLNDTAMPRCKVYNITKVAKHPPNRPIAVAKHPPKRSTTNTMTAAKHPLELNNGKVSASEEKGGKASASDDQRNSGDADETGQGQA
jgi:hypothetical protein